MLNKLYQELECLRQEQDLSYSLYLEKQIQDGYMDKDGKPLKCECGNKDFEMINDPYCQYGVEEYVLKCTECNKVVGHWAYGYWQV